MTRGMNNWVVLALLVGLAGGACSSPDASHTGTEPCDTEEDCSSSGDASLECKTRTLCAVEQTASGLSAALQPVDEFCMRETLPESPSAGIYLICVVNPASELFLIWDGGSRVLEMAGWTHSGYGGGNIKSTLNEQDELRCQDARGFALEQASGQPAGCSS
jgi:hypothetical protein